jgi:hypothetical protein
MEMISSRSFGRTLLAALSAMTFIATPCRAQSSLTTSFNHALTGFPLTGTHISVSCASCHAKGRFDGAPTQCIGCHNTMTAPGEPQSHPRTTNRCESCHLTTTWRDLRFIDHVQALGPCANCHNGKLALGKSVNHIVTSAPCENCHLNTVTFAGATAPASTRVRNATSSGTTTPAAATPGPTGTAASVPGAVAPGTSAAPTAPSSPNALSARSKKDHGGIINGCATCHNGAGAPGKPQTHIATNAPCETCHKSRLTFAGARMSHAGLIANCASCHNSRAATGKPANHIITSAPCEACHKSTVTFAGARVDHSLITSTCSNCHNGTMAEGKAPRHFLTALPCNSCHRTSTWIPADYRHTSPAYVRHSAGSSCTTCHISNAQAVSWKFPALRPNCAGCHADQYRPMAHVKFQRPVKGFYTVAELKDCAGSCHTFADSTQRTVLTRSFAVHRSIGGW